jgi:hypothetical protein
VVPPTQLTHDAPGAESGYRFPGLAALDGARAMVLWSSDGDRDVHYAVLDSDGTIVAAASNLTADGSSSEDWSPVAAQLAGGHVLAAWRSGNGGPYHVRYAVLDSSYNVMHGPAALNAPNAMKDSWQLSATASPAGRGILTWVDDTFSAYVLRSDLVYALVEPGGAIVTPPMIFRTSSGTTPGLHAGFGQAATSYGTPIAEDVDGHLAASSLAGGPAGGTANLHVRASNRGQTTASGVVLTATLHADLGYAGDTSGITPVVAGNTVVWSLPDLAFLAAHEFGLRLSLPLDAALGTRFPVTLTLASAGPEAEPADNTAASEVMAALQLFMPVVGR